MNKEEFFNTKWDISSWNRRDRLKFLKLVGSNGFAVNNATYHLIDSITALYISKGLSVTHGYDLSSTCGRKEKFHTDVFPFGSTEKHAKQQLAKARFDGAAKPKSSNYFYHDEPKNSESDGVGINYYDQTGGGSCNYYKVKVEHPTTLPEPYEVECNDLIESLGLTFAEANIYKELFRTANERTHSNEKQGNTPARAAEKVLFFALRNAIHNGVNVEKFLYELNIK